MYDVEALFLTSSNPSISARSIPTCFQAVPFSFKPSSTSCGRGERDSNTKWREDFNVKERERAHDWPKPRDAPVIRQSVEAVVVIAVEIVDVELVLVVVCVLSVERLGVISSDLWGDDNNAAVCAK